MKNDGLWLLLLMTTLLRVVLLSWSSWRHGEDSINNIHIPFWWPESTWKDVHASDPQNMKRGDTQLLHWLSSRFDSKGFSLFSSLKPQVSPPPPDSFWWFISKSESVYSKEKHQFFKILNKAFRHITSDLSFLRLENSRVRMKEGRDPSDPPFFSMTFTFSPLVITNEVVL